MKRFGKRHATGDRPRLDDRAAEDLVAGRRHPHGDMAAVGAFLAEMRMLRQGPVPPPSAPLARLLATGVAPGDAPGAHTAPRETALVRAGSPQATTARAGLRGARLPRTGVAAGVALAMAAAATSLTVAGALDVLPGPAQRMVAEVVGAVTPLELPRREGPGPGLDESPGTRAAPNRREQRPTVPAAHQPRSASPSRAGPDGGVGAPVPPTASPAVASSGSSPPTTAARAAVPPGVPMAPGRSPVSPIPPAAPEPSPPPSTSVPRPTPPAPSSGTAESAGPTRWTATVSGSSEVPGPGAADAGGTVSLDVEPVTGQLCFTLAVSAVAPITEVHVHEAASGRVGPPVVRLSPSTNGAQGGCGPVKDDVLKRMRADAAGFYVELHNRDFPEGALRGQLSP